ncbi:hypothetical protein BGZ51_006035 [Haplosporangium sp. Z 767]|nr:hypothetical protein BGZ51_006035 [Haplosporangium sp. Z 767]
MKVKVKNGILSQFGNGTWRTPPTSVVSATVPLTPAAQTAKFRATNVPYVRYVVDSCKEYGDNAGIVFTCTAFPNGWKPKISVQWTDNRLMELLLTSEL